MAAYLCKWPDKTVSVVVASSEAQLFSLLDELGDPGAVECVKIKTGLHICFKTETRQLDYADIGMEVDPLDPPEFMTELTEVEFVSEELMGELGDFMEGATKSNPRIMHRGQIAYYKDLQNCADAARKSE